MPSGRAVRALGCLSEGVCRGMEQGARPEAVMGSARHHSPSVLVKK